MCGFKQHIDSKINEEPGGASTQSATHSAICPPAPLRRCAHCKFYKKESVFSKGQKECKECNKKNRENRKEGYKRRMDMRWEEVKSLKERTCVRCRETKIQNEFSKKQKRCKQCDKTFAKRHPDKKVAYNKKYVQENKEELSKYQKEYKKRNKKILRKKANAREVARRKKDANYRMRRNLKARVYFGVRFGRKSASTMELLGCTIDELKSHLEKMFDGKMTWENYGSYWHIDHCLPLASFDLTIPENQKKCFHWSNLQPLEGKENQSKGNKVLEKYLTVKA